MLGIIIRKREVPVTLSSTAKVRTKAMFQGEGQTAGAVLDVVFAVPLRGSGACEPGEGMEN
jgi:hypothetical protein